MDSDEFEHQREVVYGYKDGMGLLMNVFAPREKANGAGVIFVVSSGMNSKPKRSRLFGEVPIARALLEGGYVVFAVVECRHLGWTRRRRPPPARRCVHRRGRDSQQISHQSRDPGRWPAIAQVGGRTRRLR